MLIRAILPLLVLVFTVSLGQAQPIDSATKLQAGEAYGRLPLHFEANRRQVDARVRFLARGVQQTVFFTPDEVRFVFTRSESSPRRDLGPETRTTGAVLRMTLVGGTAEPRVSGEEQRAGHVHYLRGKHPSGWRTHIPTYGKVAYQDVYPGIDLVWYGTQRRLEYDFIVRPGAEPESIVVEFHGAECLEVDSHGDLVLQTAAGPVRHTKPFIYQEVAGVRREVTGGFVLKGPQQIGFQVAAYDRSRPLVIDPGIVYSTFLGGSGTDRGIGIAVDLAGNAYVTGLTDSMNFPTTVGAFDTTLNGEQDVFVTKLDPAGSALVYSTYLGGSRTDQGLGIAVDLAGNAYVTGRTSSTDFPTTEDAHDPTLDGIPGTSDAFVTKLDPTGATLVYSTYLGGRRNDQGLGIAVDWRRNAYVTGFTASEDFPTTAGAYDATFNGTFDAFVTKLNVAGSGLVYSTFLGGGLDEFGRGIAVDWLRNAYVTGHTLSEDFPTTAGAFDTMFNGEHDAFVTKLNAAGSALVYSTYLGGTGDDEGFSVAVDWALNAYVTGHTASGDFPTTADAFDTGFNGLVDAFVTKVSRNGADLVYSTYLGGSGDDRGRGIAVDWALNAYVTGVSESEDFPTTFDAFDTTRGGPSDAFVTKVSRSGADLAYSTYLGGGERDEALGIAVDLARNAYVTGVTSSANFPTTPGAFDTTPAVPGGDAFVTKLDRLPGNPDSAGDGIAEANVDSNRKE